MISFYFKEMSSTGFSTIVVEELPDIVVPAKKLNKIKIDGKNGNIYQDLGYDDVIKTVRFALKNISELDEINKWLQGSGVLILSNEPGKLYRASVLSSFSYERAGRYREVAVDFTCEPFKYKADEELIVFKSSEDITQTVFNFDVDGTVSALPKMTLKGVGIVTFLLDNSEAFTLNFGDSTSTIIIDCETEKCYLNTSLNCRCMNGEFIKLDPGAHSLEFSEQVDEITIERRSRFI